MRIQAGIGVAEIILGRPGVMTAILLGSVVIGAVAWAMAGRLGWSRVAAGLSACGLALALAVTLARPGVFDIANPQASSLRTCVMNSFSLSGTLDKLNFIMLMPFAFFGTLAAGRPLPIMASCAMLSCGIEAFQAMTGIGVCEANDVYTNAAGGVLAVLAGWLLFAVFGGRDRIRRRRAASWSAV